MYGGANEKAASPVEFTKSIPPASFFFGVRPLLVSSAKRKRFGADASASVSDSLTESEFATYETSTAGRAPA